MRDQWFGYEIKLDENIPKDKIVIVANVNNEPTAEYFANRLDSETWTEYMLRKEREFHKARLFGVEAKKKPTFLGYVATENIQIESNGTFELMTRISPPQSITIKVDVSCEIEKLDKNMQEDKIRITTVTTVDMQGVKFYHNPPEPTIKMDVSREIEKWARAYEMSEKPKPPVDEATIDREIAELEKDLEKYASMTQVNELHGRIVAMAPGGIWEDGHVVKAGKLYNIEIENGRGESIFCAKNVTSLDLSLAEYGPGAYRVFIDEVEE